MRAIRVLLYLTFAGGLCASAPMLAQPLVSESAQGVNVNLVEVELRAAVQALSQFLDRPVLYGSLGNQRVTFTSARPVPRADLPGLLRMLLAGQGYVMEDASGAYQITGQAAPAGTAGQAPSFQPRTGVPASGPLTNAGGAELFVIHLRHARAADVSATVNALYGRAGAIGEIGARPTTLNHELNANRVAPHGDPSPTVSPPPVASGELSGNVVIVPDHRTNSLLIRASQADYALIHAAVEQVDVRPLQVLIEVTVAYVRRDFSLAYGIEASVGDVRVPGSENTHVGGASAGGTTTDLVIRALNLGGIDLNLMLRAGQRRSSVVIVDRPLLLAANNEEAEIVVGEQRPFVQVQRSTDGGVLDEVVQYKDVGTSLRVLPTISADGFVQMRVVQEVNSAAGIAGGGIDAPVISTRSVQTQLLVRDEHTAVLGGLTNSQRDRSSGGIPLLSDIPVIGGIFGRRARANNEFELFVFITPHVIYTDDEMTEAADDLRLNRPNVRGATGERPLITPTPPELTPSPEQVPAEGSPPQQPVPAPPL